MRIYLIITFILFFFLNPKTAWADVSVVTPSAQLVSPKKDINNDLRPTRLEQFLNKHKSPLADYSEDFVNYADKYNLDWRLVPAISGVESTFAQQLPYNSYNAWGWGIYGNNILYFKSYDEAIKTISKSLREDYINQWGAKDVYQIGRIYASSPTWAQRVVGFMDKIDKFAQDNPKYHLSLSI